MSTDDFESIKNMIYRKSLGFDRFPVWRIERFMPTADLKPIKDMVFRDHSVNLRSEENLIVSPALHIPGTYSWYELYPRQETTIGPVVPIKFTKKTLEPHVIDKLEFDFEIAEPISYLHLFAIERHENLHVSQLRCLLMLKRYLMEEILFQMAALAASKDSETRRWIEGLRALLKPPDWVEVEPIILQFSILVDPGSLTQVIQDLPLKLIEEYARPSWGLILIDVIREHGMDTHKAFLNYAGLNQPTTDVECAKKIDEYFERACSALTLTRFKCFNSLDEIEHFIIEKRREISNAERRLPSHYTVRDILDVIVEYGVVTADELDDHDGRVFKLLEWAIKRDWPLKGFKDRAYQMHKLFKKWEYEDYFFIKLVVDVLDFSDGDGGFDRYVFASDPVLGRFSLGLYVSRAVADQVLRGLKPTCPFQSVSCPQFEEFWHCNPGHSGMCLPECPVKSFQDVETGYGDKERRDWLDELIGRMGFLMKVS